MNNNLNAIKKLVVQSTAIKNLLDTLTDKNDDAQERISSQLTEIMGNINESIDELLIQIEKNVGKT